MPVYTTREEDDASAFQQTPEVSVLLAGQLSTSAWANSRRPAEHSHTLPSLQSASELRRSTDDEETPRRRLRRIWACRSWTTARCDHPCYFSYKAKSRSRVCVLLDRYRLHSAAVDKLRRGQGLALRCARR